MFKTKHVLLATTVVVPILYFIIKTWYDLYVVRTKSQTNVINNYGTYKEGFGLFSSNSKDLSKIAAKTKLRSIIKNDAYYKYPLRDYYVFSSYCTANDSNQFDNSKLSIDVLRKTLKIGVRFIDLEIFTMNSDIVVGVSKLNSNIDIGSTETLRLVDVLRSIVDVGFNSGLCPNSNDPLFIHLNIKTKLTDSYNKIAKIINQELGPKLLDIKYGNCYGGQNLGKVIITELLNKVVIIINDDVYKKAPNTLRELTNMTSNGQNVRMTDSNTILYQSNMNDVIDYNKNNMTIVHAPRIYNEITNPDIKPLFDRGCQFVLVSMITNDKFKTEYIKMFNDRRHAFILKPEKLRSIPKIITPPKKQDPNLSLGNQERNGIII